MYLSFGYHIKKYAALCVIVCMSAGLIAYPTFVAAQSSVGGPGSGSGQSTGGSGSTGGTSVGGPGGGGIPSLKNPIKIESVGDAVRTGVEIFSYIVILFAVLVIIWIGLQYILARGRPEKLKELNKWLLWAVVGIAIVLGARIIVDIIISTLQSSGAVDPNVIQSARDALGK